MYENIDKTRYTPMMRQYLEIKEDYPDSLVFFRLGDFYEMFFNDALVASRELEIVLTGRDAGANNERVPMCGVPHHAVEGYIEKLTNKGYKVAIVEQLEEAGGKKIVERNVIKVVTPGTNIDERSLDDKSNNYLASLEIIGDEYVLSYIDLSIGTAMVTVLSGSIELVFSEIVKLSIKEIVIASTFNKNLLIKLNKVYNILLSFEDNLTLDEYLNNLFINIDKRFLKGPKRLISYLIKTQKRILIHLKPFVYYTTKDYLRLDNSAVSNLELIISLRGSRNKNNLFAVLDHCATAMGARFLKQSILYPLVDWKKINERHNLIEDLLKNYLYTDELYHQLQEIYDLERIIGRISYGNLSPKDLIQLKRSLSAVPNIKEILTKMKGKTVNDCSNNLETFNELVDLLEQAIDENAGYTIKDGGVIRSGYNQELDQIRSISNSNKDFLVNFEVSERERTGIKNLKVGFNKVFGYYIEVTKSYLSLVKDDFGYIRKQTTSNSERYITQELKERETLILRSDESSLEKEVHLFNEVRDICKKYIPQLQILSSNISEIDMLLSLANVAKSNQYVRPIFSNYDEMEIIDGRHPVIECFDDKEFIPNDLKLYNNDKILLITGPNMSGKSTFMRQNALIVIMAQMGSYVPATYAKLPIFDQIFTRIGSSDDITSGESTFMSEMLEVNYALENATIQSLIILDEVGRGTATFDGMALAQAIIEHIHNNIGAKTFFSTHYHELTNLENSLSFLRNVHVEAIVGKNNYEIVFLHKVLPGPSDQSYGINVASLAKIPLEVTLRAEDILSKLEAVKGYDSELTSLTNYQKPTIIDKTDVNLVKLKENLIALDLDNIKPIDALMILADLKEKAVKSNNEK